MKSFGVILEGYDLTERVRHNNYFDIVGRAPQTMMIDHTFELPTDWNLLTSEIPELGVYCKHDRSVESCKENLINMCAYVRGEESEECEYFMDEALMDLIAESPVGVLPDFMKPNLEGKYKLVPRVIDVLEATLLVNQSTDPGYPYNILFKTKGEFLSHNFLRIYCLVCIRFLSWHYVAKHCRTPLDYVMCYSADPYLCKEKNEVTKVSKPSRVYTACSVIEELCYKTMFNLTITENKRYWGFYYNCIGIGFTQEASDRLRAAFDGLLSVRSTDVPKFDAGVTASEKHRARISLLCRMGVGDLSPYMELVYYATEAGNNPLYLFADGELWSPKQKGKTQSGHDLTSSDNTTIRANRCMAVHILRDSIDAALGRELLPRVHRFAGDDGLETDDERNHLFYTRLGLPLRDDKRVSTDKLEMCSTLWSDGPPVGQRIYKSASHLLFQKDPKLEQVSAFVLNYMYHPDFDRLINVIQEHRPGIKLINKQLKYQVCGNKRKIMTKKNNKKNLKITVNVPKQKTGRNKGRRNRRGGRMRMGAGSNTALAKAVCAISNPFCPEAEGRKIPDLDTTKSLTCCSKQVIPVTTDGTGKCAFVVTVNPIQGYTSAATYSAGNVVATWNAWNYTRFNTLYAGSIGRWRVVSAGSEWQTTQAWTSATGVITVNELVLFETTNTPDISTVDSGLRGEAYPLRDAKIKNIMRPQGTNPYDYQAYSSTSNPYSSMMYGITGATNSTNVGFIELTINYEWVPVNGNGLMTFTTQAAQDNRLVISQRANALQNVPLSFKSDNVDEGFMMHAAETIVSTLGTLSTFYDTGSKVYDASKKAAPALAFGARAAALMF